MSYSVVNNDIVDVDQLIKKIKDYAQKFNGYDKNFSHYKNVERFERNLEAQVPDLKDQIAEIYCVGRDLAYSIPGDIYEYLTIERTGFLKTGIDRLEAQITHSKKWAEADYAKVKDVYSSSGYDEWSVNRMLAETLQMCEQLKEILILINIIKSSYTYQIQAGEITAAEIREEMRVKMNTTHNTGNFQNSLIASGNNNTSSMTVNQNSNEEIALVCQKLIETINQSVANTEEKEAVKAVVEEIKGAQNKSELKNAYNKLMSTLSNHITVGTAILGSSMLPTLTNLII